MSERIYSEDVVYSAISSSLRSLRLLARILLKRRWASMSYSEKYEAGRALAVLNILSGDPEKYFSNHETHVSRRENATSQNVNRSDMYMSVFAVDSPVFKFHTETSALYSHSKNFSQTFIRFVRIVYLWERDRFSPDPVNCAHANKCAKSIVDFSKSLERAVEMHSQSPFVEKIKKFYYNIFQR